MTLSQAPADELLTVQEVADELRVPAATFRTWRSLGRGPQSFRIGRRVVYRRSAVERWLREQETATARGDGVDHDQSAPPASQTAAVRDVSGGDTGRQLHTTSTTRPGPSPRTPGQDHLASSTPPPTT